MLNDIQKKEWSSPKLTVHGSVEEITQQTKYKTFGSGDDVIVNNLSILANIS
jgi:hypothetical protein